MHLGAWQRLCLFSALTRAKLQMKYLARLQAGLAKRLTGDKNKLFKQETIITYSFRRKIACLGLGVGVAESKDKRLHWWFECVCLWCFEMNRTLIFL